MLAILAVAIDLCMSAMLAILAEAIDLCMSATHCHEIYPADTHIVHALLHYAERYNRLSMHIDSNTWNLWKK